MKEVQEKINQIQIIQQNMHTISLQRQQFQIQETEIESALTELEKTEKSFKIIGNIMVQYDKLQLKKELQEKLEMLTIRISTLEKQEDNLRNKAEELQKEILVDMEKNGNKQTNNTRKH